MVLTNIIHNLRTTGMKLDKKCEISDYRKH